MPAYAEYTFSSGEVVPYDISKMHRHYGFKVGGKRPIKVEIFILGPGHIDVEILKSYITNCTYVLHPFNREIVISEEVLEVLNGR